jgi:hypothetical protein
MKLKNHQSAVTDDEHPLDDTNMDLEEKLREMKQLID